MPVSTPITESDAFRSAFSHRKAQLDTAPGGLAMHYVVGGSGPAVFLLHGWLGTSYTWRRLMPLLAERYTVVAPDLRGCGDTAKPPTGYDAASTVADVRALRAAIGLDDQPAFVVGHDMGAPPALLWAARHPDEVSGAVYLDEPLPGVNLDEHTRFARETGGGFWWFGFNHQYDLAEMFWQGHEAEVLSYFFTQMAADPTAITDADIAEYARTLRAPGGVRGQMGWYREVFDTADQLAALTQDKVTVPVFGIGGEYGIAGTGEQMALVATETRGATIERCGHLMPEEQPQALADHLLDFFEARR